MNKPSSRSIIESALRNLKGCEDLPPPPRIVDVRLEHDLEPGATGEVVHEFLHSVTLAPATFKIEALIFVGFPRSFVVQDVLVGNVAQFATKTGLVAEALDVLPASLVKELQTGVVNKKMSEEDALQALECSARQTSGLYAALLDLPIVSPGEKLRVQVARVGDFRRFRLLVRGRHYE